MPYWAHRFDGADWKYAENTATNKKIGFNKTDPFRAQTTLPLK